MKIQKKKKKQEADFQNATNANEKGRKKEMKKIVFENTKKSGNEVAAFQNATNANKKGSKKKRQKIVFENAKNNQEARLPLFKMQKCK